MVGPVAALLLLVALTPQARADDGAHERPGPPRPIGPTTLVALGEDARLGVLVDGATLVTWAVDDGKKRITARLPKARWTGLHLAPRTDGETERAIVTADGRAALVHLRTGRVIADWTTPFVLGRVVSWAPDGTRVALVGWEVPGLLPGSGLPVLWVDAETGTVVSQLRLPDGVSIRGATAIDQRRIAVGVDKRVVVLGPGPNDAKTMAIDHQGVVGATRDGIVVLKKGALVVIDAASGKTAKEVAKIRAPVDLGGGLGLWTAGRWGVVRTPDAWWAIDFVKARATALSPALLGRGAVVPTAAGIARVGAKTIVLELAAGVPERWLLRVLCTRGTCRAGDGTRVDLVLNEEYSGAFKAGEPSGQGRLRFADGAIYSGPFVKGRPHGDGVLITADGDEKRVRALDGVLSPR